jgi:hypothetical protein
VVSAEQNKRLAFTCTFPPSLSALRQTNAQTQVSVTLARSGSGTKVTVDQTGFAPLGADGQAGLHHFDHVWDLQLARLERYFKRGKIGCGWPYAPTQLKWMAGTWKSGDEKRGFTELWVANENGLTGSYREVMNGQAGFFELSNIAREGDELVLSMRMFDRSLKDAKKTAAGPLRFVLDQLDGQKAVFVGDGTNKGSLTYELLNPHHLRITLDRADGAPVEHFDFGRFFP